MRTKFLIALAAFLFVGMTSYAQVYKEQDDTDKKDQQTEMQNDQDQMMQDQSTVQMEAERKAMIANVMNLEGEESEDFWPVYEEYRSEMGKLQEKEINLMNEYAQSYATLTDDQANEMLKSLLEIDKEEAKVKKDYRSKFENALPPTKVARFYQADNKIDLAQKYDAAKRIPIVDVEEERDNQMQDQYRQQQQQEQDQYRQYEYEDDMDDE